MRKEILEFTADTIGEHAPESYGTSRPVIYLPSGLTEISAAAKDIFTRMAAVDATFYRGGKVHEVKTDGDGRLRLEPLSPEAFRSRIERLGSTKAYIKNQRGEYCLNPKRPTYEDCKAILATTEAAEYLRPIANIYAAPVLVLDQGELRTLTKGYHPINGGAFVCDGEIVPEVDPGEAAHKLEQLLCDFRFVSESDRTRSLSTLISPALRFGSIIRGNCPIHSNEADQSQTGKGYNLEMVAAIYGERPALVAMKNGGVGSFDEALSQRLIDGRPFIQFDNLRGKLDSQFLEAVLTAPGEVGCRIPHRGEVYVNPRTYFFAATSNGFESTNDLANRSAIIRLRKQPQRYHFKQWPKGDLIDHVRENHLLYLGCVHAVIRAWWNAGATKSEYADHDFREWARTLEGIIRFTWPDAAPLMGGHQQAQARTTNPALNWLRSVCLAVEAAGQLGWRLKASEIAELSSEQGIEIPGLADQHDANKATRTVGMLLRRCIPGSDTLSLDEYQVTRKIESVQRHDHPGTFTAKTYEVSRAE